MGKMKAVATAFAVIAMTVCLVGCGGGNAQQGQQAPKEDSPANLEVVDVGFTVLDNDEVSYGAIIKNPNKTWAAERIELTVAARGKDGNILYTMPDYLTLMFADGETAIGGSIYVTGDVASIEITPSVSRNNWSQQDITESQYLGEFPISGANETPGSYGILTVAGEVTNNTEGVYELSKVNVLFMKDGAIVGGSQTYLNGDLQPGSTMPFSNQLYRFPEHDDFSIYFDPGYPQTN